MTHALFNHLWQSTLFVGVMTMLAWLLREHGAHVRYWLWCAASLKFLLPFHC
jgi:bla regulator protein blaR1